MKKRYFIAALAAVIAVSFALPAFGAPSPTKLLKQALGLSKKADKRSKLALKLAQKKNGNGPQGAQGPQGPQGQQGIQGLQGDQGNAGADGAQGAQGPQGLPGLKGDQGNQGNKGDKGDQGNQGNNGHDGLNGPPGGQGPPGLDGNPGHDGLPGPPGGQGPPGLQGLQGNNGHDGLPGPPGGQGPPGQQGSQGPQGPKGDQGNGGPQGPKGDQGPQGDPAAPGSIGNTQLGNGAVDNTKVKKHSLGAVEIGSGDSSASVTGTTSLAKNACVDLTDTGDSGTQGDFVVFNAPSDLANGLLATSLGLNSSGNPVIRVCNIGSSSNIQVPTTGWSFLIIPAGT